MNRMWRIVAEIEVQPGDLPSGNTRGFVNVTTWAKSADDARNRIEHYISGFGWHIMSIEAASPVDDDEEYGDEVKDMITRTRTNPDAIILGTFHGYKRL